MARATSEDSFFSISEPEPFGPSSLNSTSECDLSTNSSQSGTVLRTIESPHMDSERLCGSAPFFDRDAQHLANAGVQITCFDYGFDRFLYSSIDATDVPAFLLESREDWVNVRWINIEGLHQETIHRLAHHFGIHELSVEDVLEPPQRAKVDHYPEYVFILGRRLHMERNTKALPKEKIRKLRHKTITSESSNRRHYIHRVPYSLGFEQCCMFVFSNTVITIRNVDTSAPLDNLWDRIKDRISAPSARHWREDASHLMFLFLEEIVHQCFHVLEHFGNELEDIEMELSVTPSLHVIKDVHFLRNQLLLLRRNVLPIKEIINGIQRRDHSVVSKSTRSLLQDVVSHHQTVVDILETYRELGQNLRDGCVSQLTHQLSEIMKVLTVMDSVSIPLVLLVTIFGMNFDDMLWDEPANLGLFETDWGYPYFFWSFCFATVVVLSMFFYHRGMLRT